MFPSCCLHCSVFLRQAQRVTEASSFHHSFNPPSRGGEKNDQSWQEIKHTAAAATMTKTRDRARVWLATCDLRLPDFQFTLSKKIYTRHPCCSTTILVFMQIPKSWPQTQTCSTPPPPPPLCDFSLPVEGGSESGNLKLTQKDWVPARNANRSRPADRWAIWVAAIAQGRWRFRFICSSLLALQVCLLTAVCVKHSGISTSSSMCAKQTTSSLLRS